MKSKSLLLFIALILILSGCVEFSKKGSGMKGTAMLEPQSIFKFSDIPVPAGFKYLPAESYAFVSSAARAGLLKYRGKANADQVINFYKEQMALYNWDLLNIVEYGERMLNFERDDETCIVTLIPKGNQVTISISLAPKAQTLKKQAKPLK